MKNEHGIAVLAGILRRFEATRIYPPVAPIGLIHFQLYVFRLSLSIVVQFKQSFTLGKFDNSALHLVSEP